MARLGFADRDDLTQWVSCVATVSRDASSRDTVASFTRAESST